MFKVFFYNRNNNYIWFHIFFFTNKTYFSYVCFQDEPIQVIKSDAKEVDDIDGTEKLELLRATVSQLEKELEKQKKEYESKLEKQKEASQEKITKLQAQLNQEVENKNQLT